MSAKPVASEAPRKRRLNRTVIAHVTTPKRHHYLPEAYLRGFTRGGAAESPFAVYDRVRDEFRSQTPHNTAVATHFYTVETSSGEKSTHIEAGLAELEGLAMPVVRKIAAREGITSVDRQNLAIFVALLHTRVPQFERGTLEMADGLYKATTKLALPTRESVLQRLQALYPDQPLDQDRVDEIFNIFQSGDYDMEFNKGWLRRLMLETAQSVSWGLWQMDWVCYEAPTRTSFITTDSPFIVIPPRDFEPRFPFPYGIGTIGTVKIVPLTQSVCLCVGDRGMSLRHEAASQAEVRAINIQLALRSERMVVGRDMELLRNIVGKSRLSGTSPGPIIRVS